MGAGAGVAGAAGAGAAAQPRTINENFAGPATDENAAQPVSQRISTPKLSTPTDEDYDDDEDGDDDVKGGGWFSGIKNKMARAFNDAFRNPDEGEDDGDDY